MFLSALKMPGGFIGPAMFLYYIIFLKHHSSSFQSRKNKIKKSWGAWWAASLNGGTDGIVDIWQTSRYRILVFISSHFTGWRSLTACVFLGVTKGAETCVSTDGEAVFLITSAPQRHKRWCRTLWRQHCVAAATRLSKCTPREVGKVCVLGGTVLENTVSETAQCKNTQRRSHLQSCPLKLTIFST